MSQHAEANGNHITVIQINGDGNIVENGGPHLSLELQTSIHRNNDDTENLYVFYPRARSTTFIGREAALNTLTDFLNSSLPISFMVLTGEGGSGKTRMAVELCHSMRDQEWAAGFTTTRSLQNFIASCTASDGWKCRQNTLVVLDYAASVAQPLHDWFEWLTSAQLEGSRVRILLLERTADPTSGWLREVTGWGGERSCRIGKLHDSASPYELGPLASREDCLALVQNVLNNRGHTDTAWQQNAPFLQQLMEATLGGLPLFLMMAAHNIHTAGRPVALTREMLALEFAKREAERIRNRAHAKNLHESFLLELVACVTLAQGADRDKIRLWVRKELEREYTGCVRDYVTLLYELLPNTPEADGERLLALRPDVIGEAYIWHILRKQKQFVLRCLKEFGTPVLETLLRLAHDFGGVYTEPLHWLDAVLEAKNHPRELAALAALIPSPSMPLRAFKLATAEKLLKKWKEENSAIETDSKKIEYASLLNDYALGLSEMGQREQALGAAYEAVKIRRELSAINPTAFRPVLAGSLNNLANMLSAVGQRKQALDAAQEAADIYRHLSAGNTDVFRPYLAMSLNTLANTLSDVGQRAQEALETAQEAVKIRRKLSAANPAAFLADLARSLNNLVNTLSDVGQRKQALEAAQEAADLYRDLSAANPAAFRQHLAMALNNLAKTLSDVGQREQAFKAAQEAVDLYRDLYAGNPTAFRPDLAASLNTLANKLSHVGQSEDALKVAKVAVELYRNLCADNPVAFRPNLAMSLNNLAISLRHVGQREKALNATQEAVGLYRDLSAANPTAFRPNFAMSLNNLATMLSHVGQSKQALEAAQESVSIRRDLSATNPAAFRPNLAMSLNNLAKMLSDVGQCKQALETALEATDLYRDLCAGNPAAFRPNLAASLNNLANSLSYVDQRELALEAAQEAVCIRRDLCADNLTAFRQDLAMSLNTLANRLSDLGQHQQALEVALEAVEIYRDLSTANPDAFRPNLAAALNNLISSLNHEGQHQQALEVAQEAQISTVT